MICARLLGNLLDILYVLYIYKYYVVFVQMASINFIRSILQISLSCFLLSNYNNGVEGGRRLISKEEDMKLEKQLNLLNKPAIKSIQVFFFLSPLLGSKRNKN